MTKYIRFVIFIHDPKTSLFKKYKYRQRERGFTGDSESEDEATIVCKKYGKKEAGASDSFYVASKSLEIWNPQFNMFR
jgi:hypothetical protein